MHGRAVQSSGHDPIHCGSPPLSLDMDSPQIDIHVAMPRNDQNPSASQFPLFKFLTSPDGPWNPQGSGVQEQQAAEPLQLPNFCNASSLSDCATAPFMAPLPSDSGYESITKRSVCNTSVAGEYDQIPEYVSGTPSVQFQDMGPGVFEPRKDLWKQPASVRIDGAVTKSTPGPSACQFCSATLKTKSELK